MKILKLLLYPISLLYGLGVMFRNMLFNIGILPSKSFRIHIISVGNLSTGGSGKTPHIEYLVKLLSGEKRTAVLSRGYMRKSSGFKMVEPDASPGEVGDEPLQMKKKFPEITIAVDENRVRGINKILQLIPETQVVLLDDAYQHRYVNPGINILLTDYNKMYIDDTLIPTGNLREWPYNSNRADIIVVTKTPKIFSPLEKRVIKDKLKVKPYQHVFFSYEKYGNFYPLKKEENTNSIHKDYYFSNEYSIVLVTGIAKPRNLYYYLKDRLKEVVHLKFPDHHNYTVMDINKMKTTFEKIKNTQKIILTTEKDAMRLSLPKIMEILGDLPVFYLKMEIDFHQNDKENFNEHLITYIRRNSIGS